MSERWVKLYEKLESSSFYHDSELVHLWVHLLIKASKFGNEFIFDGEEKKLLPGQLITGRKKLSEQTGISESKIQRALKTFENCHMIEQQTYNKYRLISILKWDYYQTSEQQMNNKRTTNEQQTNTIKKDRKIESKNKDIVKPESVSEQTWNDFLTHRKTKKASVTETVIKTFTTESEKAGWNLEDVLKESIARGWTGFKAEWVNKAQQSNGNSRAQALKQKTDELLKEYGN